MRQGKEETRRNSIYVVNERGEEYINFEDAKANLRIRSMFEEDEKIISRQQKLTEEERKQLKKNLKLPDSESGEFVIEELTSRNGGRRIVAAARANNKEELFVTIRTETKPGSKFFETEKECLNLRIRSVASGLFKATNAEENGVIHMDHVM